MSQSSKQDTRVRGPKRKACAAAAGIGAAGLVALVAVLASVARCGPPPRPGGAILAELDSLDYGRENEAFDAGPAVEFRHGMAGESARLGILDRKDMIKFRPGLNAQPIWVPRDVTHVSATSMTSFASPTLRLGMLQWDRKPEEFTLGYRAVLEDSADDYADGDTYTECAFAAVVRALGECGLSRLEAEELLGDVCTSLLSLNDEEFFLRIMADDRDALAEQEDVKAAAEQAVLQICRYSVWDGVRGEAWRFRRVSGSRLYVVLTPSGMGRGLRNYAVYEFGHKGEIISEGFLSLKTEEVQDDPQRAMVAVLGVPEDLEEVEEVEDEETGEDESADEAPEEKAPAPTPEDSEG